MPKPKDNPFGAYREDETESDDMPEFGISWPHAFLLTLTFFIIVLVGLVLGMIGNSL